MNTKVNYNSNGGAITLVVKSGPPCMGGFRVYYRNELMGDVHQLFQNEINSINDSVQDILPLPFSHTFIKNIRLRIVGTYGPLPNHTQVAVRYLFYQDGQLLDINAGGENEIRENIPSGQHKQYIHDFLFIS